MVLLQTFIQDASHEIINDRRLKFGNAVVKFLSSLKDLLEHIDC